MRVPLPLVKEGRVLADWVTASLREAILHGYYEPGEKLDQDRIAEELEVSRTPVREAMRRLESEGFVEVRPHHVHSLPRFPDETSVRSMKSAGCSRQRWYGKSPL